ncbi:MAG: acetylglutamate kinase, partial [Bryobacteraceae bacterium]
AASLSNRPRMVVVHGGGKQMSRFLSERGVTSQFVGGLRVTTPEVLDAVLKVVAGSVNRQLVASLLSFGVKAIGLSGLDACLVEAERLNEELGAVGRPVRVNGELLDLLTSRGYLPVVACVAADWRGHIYNVNADQMAAALAAGFGARSLVMLTDVAGVLGKDGSVLPELTPEQARQLIADGVATGGMKAKLEAALGALEAGVSHVLIAPGAEIAVLPRLLGGEDIGTRLRATKERK